MAPSASHRWVWLLRVGGAPGSRLGWALAPSASHRWVWLLRVGGAPESRPGMGCGSTCIHRWVGVGMDCGSLLIFS